MAWNDAVVTIRGIALLQQVLEGATLILDRASGGAGTVPPAELMAQTALVNEKQTFTIVKATNVPNGKKLHIMISNRDLSIGYSLQQVGIWAHVGDGNSVLFAILQDTAGISIPSEGEAQDFALNIYAVVNFSNESEFSVEIDPSTLVSMATLNEALFEYRKFVVAGGTATDIVLPNVTYEDGFSITFIVSEDNDEEDTTINGKPLYKVGTIAAPKLEADKAVTVWYNATEDVFYIVEATGGDASTVNGHTVAADVPADAEFTDTVYQHPTTPGNKHIPTGGTPGQILINTASGTVTWANLPTKTVETATLNASNWTGTTAPYTQTITVDGATSDNIILFDIGMNVTTAQYEAAMDAQLKATAQGVNQVTIKAFGEKPTINIPVQFMILG